jgi:hypothetical protein
MPSPAEERRVRGRDRTGPAVHRGFPHPATGGSLRVCGVCREPAAHTVLIAVGGLILVKDLCDRHLIEVLRGARRPP